MIAWLMDELISWLAGFVLDALGTVVDMLRGTAWHTPNVVGLPQVRQIWSRNMAIVNSLYVLGIIAAGAVAMTHDSIQVRYGVKELTPRVIFGVVAANASLTVSSMIFDAGNALTVALTGQPVAGPGAMDTIRAQVAAALDNPAVDVLAVIAAVVILALVVMLVFTWIARFAVLLIVAVTAPFALACYCLPQLDGVARLWWRTLFAALGTQVLQALTLYTGLAVFLDPQANLPGWLGMGGGTLVNLFVLLVLLWATVKIPSLMRRYVLRGGPAGGGLGSYLLRVVLVQQGVRAVLPARAGRVLARGVR